jgi:hypothetical protein
LHELDALPLPPTSLEHKRIYADFLFAYAQPAPVTERFLATVSKGRPRQNVVVHGHDRDPEGWFTENGNTICPVLFGAPRTKRRYLRLDLASHYERVADLRDGIELSFLYESSSVGAAAAG